MSGFRRYSAPVPSPKPSHPTGSPACQSSGHKLLKFEKKGEKNETPYGWEIPMLRAEFLGAGGRGESVSLSHPLTTHLSETQLLLSGKVSLKV